MTNKRKLNSKSPNQYFCIFESDKQIIERRTTENYYFIPRTPCSTVPTVPTVTGQFPQKLRDPGALPEHSGRRGNRDCGLLNMIMVQGMEIIKGIWRVDIRDRPIIGFTDLFNR